LVGVVKIKPDFSVSFGAVVLWSEKTAFCPSVAYFDVGLSHGGKNSELE
jgi:hypothetical protein